MQTHNLKQALHQLADQLPETATWKDVAYEAYVHQEIESGLAEAAAGDFAADESVQETFAKWGVHIATQMDSAQAYIAKENPQAAHAVAQRIAEATRLLLTQPEMGRPGRVAGTRE